MRFPIRSGLIVSGLVLALAAITSARAQDASSDLKALVARIQDKLQEGRRSASDLAPELAAFDALIEQYKDQKTDDVAQIAVMRAMLYLQVLDEAEKGRALLARIKTDFPGTRAAAEVDRALASLELRAKARELQEALIGKPAPELHFKWSNPDGLGKLSDLKGKVVVLDFWATWCGPCVASFPRVRELAAHYRDFPVVIIGVTSLQGSVHGLEAKPIDTRNDPSRELELMHDYIRAKEITWTIAFSEEKVFNPDYAIQGIPYVAIIAPDGTVRQAGLHPGSPLAEKASKIDAILAEFDLPVPTAN